MTETYHIIIQGKVQGIFFRANIQKKALDLGLKGQVKNLNHDKVEVMAQGEKQNINKLIEYCKKGPALAEISSVKIKKIKSKKFENFEVGY